MRVGKSTMADVAQRAGVSPATVARVLYDNGYVKTDTRELVLAAVNAVGYRPNAAARTLRTSRSYTMGMVVSEEPRNPFFSRIAHIVQLEALRRGFTVLTLNHNQDVRMEHEGIQRFLDQHVDAVIFCAAFDPSNVRQIASSGIPCVQIEREIATIGHKVVVDPIAGFRDAISHLKGLGHTSVCFMGAGPGIDRSETAPEDSVEAQRLQAFRKAVNEAGLAIGHEVLLDSYYSVEGQPLRGFVEMSKLLDSGRRPSAVICGSDVIAAGVLQAAHKCGIQVPSELSIIGFDDSFAESLTPPLTTIAQPIFELGTTAVRIAVRQIEEIGSPEVSELLTTRLVIRSSTANRR